MKVSKSISSLLSFLKEKEEKSSLFTIDELLSSTGWKRSTFITYYNKGQLSDFISEPSKGRYEASNSTKITEIEFAKKLSQSKHRRGLGHNCKSNLSKALLRKSKDNMLLALELYNRPSLENKMDAFCMCFCASWEQLLKAIIIETNGEQSIFRKSGKKGVKETISLRDSLSALYNPDSNIRRNIERIAYFRDQAVHLLMPEIQGIVSRVFQSGVLNYSAKFEEFTQVPFLSSTYAGMISLVGDFNLPTTSILKSMYGDVSEDILGLAEQLKKEVENTNDIEFAIPLSVRLVFASDNTDGNVVTLAKAEEGIEGLRKALVLEKPVDRSRSHPYRQKEAIAEINKRLTERYSSDFLQKHLVKTDKATKQYVINSNCFDAVVFKNKWKNSNNEYHYKNNDPELHYYSDALVEKFISKVMEAEGYLQNAKNSYNRRNKS